MNPTDTATSPLDDRPLDGRRDFHAAVLALARTDRAAEWWWVDPDFAGWPLDDPALIGALAQWLARPGRQLTLLACEFETLQRRHPRFVAWRRDRAHQIFGRAVDVEASQMPTLMLGATPRGLQLLDRERHRGVWIAEPAAWRDARELVDVLLQRSQPSFAATVLGL